MMTAIKIFAAKITELKSGGVDFFNHLLAFHGVPNYLLRLWEMFQALSRIYSNR